MIVAYHKGSIIYVCKGIFNYNIDHDWTGGILVCFKIIKKCTRSDTTDVQPAPSTHMHGSNDHKLLGFDKLNPYNYLANCDAIFETIDFLITLNGLTVLTQEDTMLSKL